MYRLRRDSFNEVTLNNFIKQINEDTIIISNPLFSREAIIEISKDRETSTTEQRTKGFNTGSNKVCICCVKEMARAEKVLGTLRWTCQRRKVYPLTKIIFLLLVADFGYTYWKVL